MGKRDTVVVLSSDDGGDEGEGEGEGEGVSVLSSSRSRSKPTVKSLVTRSEPRRAKKPRVSGSRSRSSCRRSSIVDEFQFLKEDFNEVFTGAKVTTGFGRSTAKESWVDKYKPCTFEELAVHKKKVEEIKSWFEERLITSKDNLGDHVLIITGPAGVGKSATIFVVASHLGATLCEWNTPTPTVWKEYIHNSNTGQYVSKLDEFEAFVERTRKYGLISQSSAGESKSPAILLIDDLPLTHGNVARRRLQNCLHLLVQSTHIPTAILITDYGRVDSADREARFLEELHLSLESAGARKIAFNPITSNAIKRILSKICSQELCNVTSEQIDLIARASGGDIRHAITSLQFFCLKADLPSLSLSSPMTVHGPHLGRDETISLFHALGKFLHNKRESACPLVKDAHPMQEKFMRLPLKMDAPEKVLSQAHGQARPIADFLHENVLDFLNEEAVDDASAVLSYLGDADVLLHSFRGAVARNCEAELVVQSAAASIAVRGALFGNSHPLPPRWHIIRKPKLWQSEKLSLHNKDEMLRQRFMVYNGVSSSDVSVIATEYMPVYKWLQHRFPKGHQAHEVMMLSTEIEDGMSLDDQDVKTSDDEIEEW
ncbi:cell cycle checkpoint protein RAD17 isoform X1 [Rhodamnia argentea]|uniref:Cell cycle checkpoint protein RAD17 isoform X1 n=1 Tax=Rhodamnia argentea TaxID=178133 RepID=A0A8B8NP33_9MYRT|nr:cell cycle checkpoint protein RAD17 isoform X1 [Rhodamnia argentea]